MPLEQQCLGGLGAQRVLDQAGGVPRPLGKSDDMSAFKSCPRIFAFLFLDMKVQNLFYSSEELYA